MQYVGSFVSAQDPRCRRPCWPHHQSLDNHLAHHDVVVLESGACLRPSGSPEKDDALHRDAEALVQAPDLIRLTYLHQTVSQVFELQSQLCVRFPNIDHQMDSGKIHRVHKTETGGSGRLVGGRIVGKTALELRVFIRTPRKSCVCLSLNATLRACLRK